MLIVGLTGGIGSGKSTAASIFADLGAVVIDADQIAREVVAPGSPAVAKIAERFGSDVVVNGAIDREKLAQIVFADPAARADLEGITHPLVGKRFEEILAQQDPDAVIIYDIPLLFESKLEGAYDVIVTIEAPLDIRRERLLARGLLPSQIDQRMAAQVSDEVRREGSDLVIVNDGETSSLREAISQIWREELLPAAQGQ